MRSEKNDSFSKNEPKETEYSFVMKPSWSERGTPTWSSLLGFCLDLCNSRPTSASGSSSISMTRWSSWPELSTRWPGRPDERWRIQRNLLPEAINKDKVTAGGCRQSFICSDRLYRRTWIIRADIEEEMMPSVISGGRWGKQQSIFRESCFWGLISCEI